MTFEISLTRHINADRDYVFDWWTDLSPDDTRLVKPLKKRQIISKTANLLVVRDEEQMYFKKMSFEVRVTLDKPSRLISEYDGSAASARSEYLLQSVDKSESLLFYHTRIKPKGFLTNLFSPLIKPFVRRIFANEMNVFIHSLEESYAKRSAKSSSVSS